MSLEARPAKQQVDSDASRAGRTVLGSPISESAGTNGGVRSDPAISHIDNLASILRDGGLHSDAACAANQRANVCIGIPGIKTARLRRPVECYPLDCVGDYVPFNFCPRSVMLYIIRQGG
jgi:hypothetical protein